MSAPKEYFVQFRLFDPVSKSERNARLPIWAVNQRHAQLLASLAYPQLQNKTAYQVRPAHSEDPAGVE
jgi:hypothetical protein